MAATVALYAHSLTGDYVYEDVTRAVAWPAPWSSRSVSIALTRLTQHALGYSSFAARSVSLALHLTCGWLVWRLARPLIGVSAALFGLALFLWHPLNTEAVAYAANQPELLVSLFTLMALCVADRSRVAAWACCSAAVLAKEPGIAAFLLVPAWMAARGRWSAQACATWIALSLLPVLACWPMLRNHGYGWPDGHVIGMNLAAYGSLLVKFALPVHQTVLPDWWSLTVGWEVALLGGWMAIFALGAWRPVLTIGASLVLLAVLPRLLWPLPGGLHEHHTYLATALLAMSLGAWLFPHTQKDSHV